MVRREYSFGGAVRSDGELDDVDVGDSDRTRLFRFGSFRQRPVAELDQMFSCLESLPYGPRTQL